MVNDNSSDGAPPVTTPGRLGPGSSSTDQWWQHLLPGVKAAIVVGIVIVGLEFFSDVLPVIGFIVTIPVAIVVYYIQGVLAGRFTRQDPRYQAAGAGVYLRQGAISAVWTALVLSTAVTLIDTMILTSLTVGTILVTLPVTLVSSLVDIFLNFFFTMLGAWLYSRFTGNGLVGISCGVLALVMVGLCAFLVVAVGFLVAGGISLFHHI